MLFPEKLPPLLGEEEFLKCMKLAKNGDLAARDKVISCNIGLVLNRVLGKWNRTNYDKEELLEVGIFGLINAVDTYDIERGAAFSTYAYRCIDNAIISFMTGNNKYIGEVSLEQPIRIGLGGDELQVKDTLADEGNDLEGGMIDKELQDEVREIVMALPDRKRRIIAWHFGFYDGVPLSQPEIGDRLGMTRQGVSIAVKRILAEIKENLLEQGLIDKTKHTKHKSLKKVE